MSSLDLDDMRRAIAEATQLSSYALHVGGEDRRLTVETGGDDGEQDTFNDSMFNDHNNFSSYEGGSSSQQQDDTASESRDFSHQYIRGCPRRTRRLSQIN